jgi:hypothetical protein
MKDKLIEVCNRAFLNSSWYPVDGGRITYCNRAVRFICSEMGNPLPLTVTFANDIYDYLKSSKSVGYWKPVSYEEGFKEAQDGNIVIAAKRGLLHGHVSVLYPMDSMQHSGSFGINVPMVFNMGKSTVGIVKLSFAFSPNPKPELFASEVNK